MIALVDMKGRRLYHSLAHKRVFGDSAVIPPPNWERRHRLSGFTPTIVSKYWRRPVQLDHLLSLVCELGQGYLLSRRGEVGRTVIARKQLDSANESGRGTIATGTALQRGCSD